MRRWKIINTRTLAHTHALAHKHTLVASLRVSWIRCGRSKQVCLALFAPTVRLIVCIHMICLLDTTVRCRRPTMTQRRRDRRKKKQQKTPLKMSKSRHPTSLAHVCVWVDGEGMIFRFNFPFCYQFLGDVYGFRLLRDDPLAFSLRL